jgi:anti-anti-sigma regulatory factor
MLKIQRSANGKVVFTLSGRIEAEDVTELQRLLELEPVARHLVLDLEDVTLADRDAVTFLMRCEQNGIRLENCPPYIREWIEREKGTRKSERGPKDRKRSARRHSQ